MRALPYENSHKAAGNFAGRVSRVLSRAVPVHVIGGSQSRSREAVRVSSDTTESCRVSCDFDTQDLAMHWADEVEKILASAGYRVSREPGQTGMDAQRGPGLPEGWKRKKGFAPGSVEWTNRPYTYSGWSITDNTGTGERFEVKKGTELLEVCASVAAAIDYVETHADAA